MSRLLGEDVFIIELVMELELRMEEVKVKVILEWTRTGSVFLLVLVIETGWALVTV